MTRKKKVTIGLILFLALLSLILVGRGESFPDKGDQEEDSLQEAPRNPSFKEELSGEDLGGGQREDPYKLHTNYEKIDEGR